MKSCNRCGQEKSLSEFYRHKQASDGHLNQCKDCVKTKAKAWKEANPERVKEYKKAYRRRNPDRVAEIRKQSDSRRPLTVQEKRRQYAREQNGTPKQKARYEVVRALRSGRLVRPDSCEECGKEASGRFLHGHHADYDKPLDVEWLCSRCHGRRHWRDVDPSRELAAKEESDGAS